MDLGAVERELCRIPSVRAARIVADATGRPVEVHILATTDKAAKQLVRDVQSVAIAAGGVELDHRIVSVVQLEDERSVAGANGEGATPTAPRAPARVVIDSVVVTRQETRATATVNLRRGADRVAGSAVGTAASTARWRIVAEASLDALQRIDPVACDLAVEMVGVQRIGDRELGIVTLILLTPPNEELLAGVAPVRGGGEDEAVARAVLDATNRRLARLR